MAAILLFICWAESAALILSYPPNPVPPPVHGVLVARSVGDARTGRHLPPVNGHAASDLKLSKH